MQAREYSTWTNGSAGPEEALPDPVRVAILALPQASMANMAAVFEDLQAVNMLPPGPAAGRRFRPRIVATDPQPRRTIAGLTLAPHEALGDDDYDVVVLPTLYDDGCLSDPDYGPVLSPQERDWLCSRHRSGAILATMCSGAYAIAETGLLDGHDSAMHPLYADRFQDRFPQVRVHRKRTLVVSGTRREIITGGQSVYSADVSLYLITHFHGAPLALEFAMLYGKTWSEAMHEAALGTANRQAQEDEVVALAEQFFHMHLTDAGLVGAAADLANMSVRTFTRRFVRATGVSPREFLTRLRMERAMRLLSGSRMPIDDVAARVGYADRSSFAKAFRERVGIPPAEYRARFQAPASLRAKTASDSSADEAHPV